MPGKDLKLEVLRSMHQRSTAFAPAPRCMLLTGVTHMRHYTDRFRHVFVFRNTPEKRYLKGWFVLDVVSSLPVSLIAHTVDGTGQENFFYMLKLVSPRLIPASPTAPSPGHLTLAFTQRVFRSEAPRGFLVPSVAHPDGVL